MWIAWECLIICCKSTWIRNTRLPCRSLATRRGVRSSTENCKCLWGWTSRRRGGWWYVCRSERYAVQCCAQRLMRERRSERGRRRRCLGGNHRRPRKAFCSRTSVFNSSSIIRHERPIYFYLRAGSITRCLLLTSRQQNVQSRTRISKNLIYTLFGNFLKINWNLN